MKRAPTIRALLIAIAIVAASLELFARFVLGLGHPPLSVAHPSIEYMFAPHQDVKRFGNRFLTNAWGMRSPAFPKRKLDPAELRIMVFGDSVINGGNLTDHAELATTIVGEELAERLERPVVVGNISAGSWGPGNWRAYAEEFGFFEADHVILVTNSGDYRDCPRFEALNPKTHPTAKPWSATAELFTRYLPRYMPNFLLRQSDSSAEPATSAAHSRQAEVGLDDLRSFLAAAQESQADVSVVQYLDREEITIGHKLDGYDEIRSVCAEMEIPAYSTRAYFPAEAADELFRDSIHPNVAGQRKLAEAILQQVFSSNE